MVDFLIHFFFQLFLLFIHGIKIATLLVKQIKIMKNSAVETLTILSIKT